MQKRSRYLNSAFARVVLAVGALAVSAAQARDLDPQTRQYVIASCSNDAYRLCPQSMSNEQETVSCMRAKRRELGQICRVAYEKAVRILSQ